MGHADIAILNRVVRDDTYEWRLGGVREGVCRIWGRACPAGNRPLHFPVCHIALSLLLALLHFATPKGQRCLPLPLLNRSPSADGRLLASPWRWPAVDPSDHRVAVLPADMAPHPALGRSRCKWLMQVCFSLSLKGLQLWAPKSRLLCVL